MMMMRCNAMRYGAISDAAASLLCCFGPTPPIPMLHIVHVPSLIQNYRRVQHEH